MNIIATYYRALADATDVELQALSIQLSAMKRRREAFHKLAEFFTPPPPTAPLGTPLPPIVPPAEFDPDYEDPPAGQEPGPAQQQDEAAP